MDFFGIDYQSVPLCEHCAKRPLVDVHHCIFKGMGWNKNLDYIENLFGLCRECHEACHDSSEFNSRITGLAKDLGERMRCYKMRERYRMENT